MLKWLGESIGSWFGESRLSQEELQALLDAAHAVVVLGKANDVPPPNWSGKRLEFGAFTKTSTFVHEVQAQLKENAALNVLWPDALLASRECRFVLPRLSEHRFYFTAQQTDQLTRVFQHLAQALDLLIVDESLKESLPLVDSMQHMRLAGKFKTNGVCFQVFTKEQDKQLGLS